MNIPLGVIRLIASYLVEPQMKLLVWIPLNKLDWKYLSKNPSIFELEKNQLKIDIEEQAKINLIYYNI